MNRLFAITAGLLLATTLPALPAGAANTPQTSLERPSTMQVEDAQHRGQAYSFAPSSSVVTPLSTPRLSARAASPRTVVYNGGGLYREVFGFAPYWELASGDLSDLQYDKVSTVAYFGLTITGTGAIQTVDPNNPGSPDPGYAGWKSQALTNVVNAAHSHGDRVVLVAKDFGDGTIYPVVHNRSYGDAAIANIIGAARARGLDGVNVDFEGEIDNSNYPTISSDYTAWMARLSSAMRNQWPGSFLTLDAYASAASSSVSFMRIDALARYVDAFFIMGYDFTTNDTLPEAPLGGPYPFTDAAVVDQFLARVGGDAGKVILGVPYYGYKYSTQNATFHAGLNGNCTGQYVSCSDPYSDIIAESQCALSFTRNWDAASSTPWASWFSPATGEPCTTPPGGTGHNSWRELYYDDAASIGAKYDLVTNRNLRGAGMWALGYDHGLGDLWSVIKSRFQVCPRTTLSTGPGAIVGAMAADQALWISRGSGFDCLGGVITSAPAISSLPLSGGGHLPIFLATAPNHDLWVRTGNSGWQQLDSSGVYCLDNPAVTVSGAAGALTLHVACQGGDHAIWYGTASPPDGAVPQTQHSSWRSLGGTVTAGPAIDMLAGQPTFYGLGSDGRIWVRPLSAVGFSQSGWECLGHPAVADSGGVARFACQGKDRALWYSSNYGAGWTGATSAGGTLVDGPGIAANGATLTLYAEGGDQAVWHRVLQPDGTLSPGWTSDGGTVSHGVGAANN